MKLLSKILASLEEVKQTQKLHSAMITSLQKQQNLASGITLQQLPGDLGDFVKRNMKLLFDSALAKQCNLTGVSRQGKRGFNKLTLFQLLFGK